MIEFRFEVVRPSGLTLDDFKPDVGWSYAPPFPSSPSPGLIDGVIVSPLIANGDSRGSLTELLTSRDGPIDPIVHVYQVVAEPGAIRAWVYHRHQYDRLAYTQGTFEIVLYDVRPNSPTNHVINVFRCGKDNPCRLHIPPFVIHGVKNAGNEAASFVNMPTRAYLPNDPDKSRIVWNDPRIPYSFK